MNIENIKEYTLQEKKELKDIDSIGYVLRHNKSGARVILIENDDNSIKGRIAEIQEMKKYLWENNAMLDDAEIASGMYNVNCDVSYTNEYKKIGEIEKIFR